jgi:hypothetical protein
MKTKMNLLMLLVGSIILMSASCKKEKTGVDGLPPATQAGAMTFGCLVNGEVFIPKGDFTGAPAKQCNYGILPGTTTLYFSVSGSEKSNSSNVLKVSLRSTNVELKTGTTIPLVNGSDGEASGSYFIFSQQDNEYKTNTASKGEFKVTLFDATKRIIAGTFWFDAVNAQGEKVEVRKGRFDMKF